MGVATGQSIEQWEGHGIGIKVGLSLSYMILLLYDVIVYIAHLSRNLILSLHPKLPSYLHILYCFLLQQKLGGGSWFLVSKLIVSCSDK